MFCPNLVFMLLLVAQASAASILIQFDEQIDLTLVTNQYTDLAFSNTTVLVSGISLNELEFPPKSGANVVFDDGGPIVIQSMNPLVSFSGYFTYIAGLTIEILDSNQNVLGSVQSAFINNILSGGDANSSPNEFLSLVYGAGFTSVRIRGDEIGGSFVGDDFIFEFKDNGSTENVPEPHAIVLMASGLACMLAFRKSFDLSRIMKAFACILLPLMSIETVFAQSVPAANYYPKSIELNTLSNVDLSVTITDTNLLVDSVVVLQLDALGRQTQIGQFNDQGINGDLQAGDKLYSGTIQVRSSQVSPIQLRVSAAFRGQLRRILSPSFSIEVLPAGIRATPSKVFLSDVVTEPQSGVSMAGRKVLVCFRAGVTISQGQSIVKQYGLDLVSRMISLGNCYEAERQSSVLTIEEIASLLTSLRSETTIESATAMRLARKASGNSFPDDKFYSIARVQQSNALSKILMNGAVRPVLIGIVDTGFNSAFGSHFRSRLRSGVNLIDNTSNTNDDDGHGTIMATITATVSDNALIVPIKLSSGCDGLIQADLMMSVVEYASGKGIRILNLSYASPPGITAELLLLFGNFATEGRAATRAAELGILITAGAGNDNAEGVVYPAGIPSIISVGNVSPFRNSMTAGPSRSLGSNYDVTVDIAAPGVGLYGVHWPVLGCPTTPAFEFPGGGTSNSTAFVSGLASLLLGTNATNSTEARNSLERFSIPLNPILDSKNLKLGKGFADGVCALRGRSEITPGQQIEILEVVAPEVDRSGSFQLRGINIGGLKEQKEWKNGTQFSVSSLDSSCFSIIGYKDDSALNDGSSLLVDYVLKPCSRDVLEIDLLSCGLTQKLYPKIKRKDRQLTITVIGSGSVSVIGVPTVCSKSCEVPIPYGTTTSLKAMPNSGSSFSGWSDACTGNVLETTVTMDQAKTCIATFQPSASGIPLTITKSGSGVGTVTSSVGNPTSISCGSTCSAGMLLNFNVQLTAAPSAGSAFTGWSEACSGTNPVTTVRMTEAKTCNAAFEPALTITTSPSGEFTIQISSTSSPIVSFQRFAPGSSLNTALALMDILPSGIYNMNIALNGGNSRGSLEMTMPLNRGVLLPDNVTKRNLLLTPGTGGTRQANWQFQVF